MSHVEGVTSEIVSSRCGMLWVMNATELDDVLPSFPLLLDDTSDSVCASASGSGRPFPFPAAPAAPAAFAAPAASALHRGKDGSQAV